MVYWDDLRFSTNYTIDPEPDYPGDGTWPCPEVRIAAADATLSGGPLALIQPTDADPWLLDAQLPGVGGLYGTPDPYSFCLVDRFHRVVVIDAREPSRRTLIHEYPISVAGAVDEGLLLIGDWTTVTAWAVTGIVWISDHLFDDDLHIRRADNGRIVCRGLNAGSIEPSEITLNAATGRIHP